MYLYNVLAQISYIFLISFSKRTFLSQLIVLKYNAEIAFKITILFGFLTVGGKRCQTSNPLQRYMLSGTNNLTTRLA